MSKFKSVFYKCFVFLGVVLGRVFNRSNFIKFVLIFSFGFFSRFLVNDFFNINVFIDYTNNISLIYYMFFGVFIVFVHEFVSLFDFVLFPFDCIRSSLVSLFNKFPGFNLSVFKISSITKAFHSFISQGFVNRDYKMSLRTEGDLGFRDDSNDKLRKSHLLFGERDKHGKRVKTSAGLQGLYGDGNKIRGRQSAAIVGLYSQDNSGEKDLFPVKPSLDNSFVGVLGRGKGNRSIRQFFNF